MFQITNFIPLGVRNTFQSTLWRRNCLTKDFIFKSGDEGEADDLDLLNWTAHIFSQSIAVDDSWDNTLGRSYLSPKQIGAVGTFLPNELINLIDRRRKYSTFIGALMFADISGFTTLCETYAKFGPEGAFRLTAMLNSYIGAMVDLIYSFGGDLLKFAGDAFLASWHVHINQFISYKVHEAISCAMHIQYSLGTYLTDVGVLLKVKIAVSAGNFVFSTVGDEINSSYIIFGFPVLEAKKAESMAESGDTIVAPSAWKFVSRRDYACDPLPEGYKKLKRILYDPRVMAREVFDFDSRQLVEINIKNETLRILTEKTDLCSSTMSFEENIRENLFGESIRNISEELRPFVIAPVMQQIDANSSFEYLTEMRQVTIMFLTFKVNTFHESLVVKMTDMAYCTISKKSETDAEVEMNKIFKLLCSMENDIIRPRTITIMGRNVTFNKTCGQVIFTTFEELCSRPLGASDYLQLSQAFHTILINDVPQLSLKLKSETRRFITLIDTLYDNRVRVVISSDVPHRQLFLKESSDGTTDEHRALMDDLNITAGSENASSNIFTGDEEMFAFDRTISRLSEMQTQDYWNQWDKKR